MLRQSHFSSLSMSPRDSACTSTAASSSKHGTSNRNSAVRFPAEVLVLGVLVACSGGGANAAADPPAPAPRPALGAPIVSGTPITSDEIRAAAAKLRANPDLGGERKFRSLRWTQSRAPDRPQKPPPWIEGLFEYLGQTGSLLIWVAGAIAAAIAVIWAYRTFKARAAVLEPMPVPSP